MFEVVPSLAHPVCSDVRRRPRERGLCAAVLVAAVAIGGPACVAIVASPVPVVVPGAGAPAGSVDVIAQCGAPPPAAEMPGVAPSTGVVAVPCVVGMWVTEARACACPGAGDVGYTGECACADCAQTDLLVLRASGEAIRASLRLSAQGRTVSAVGGKVMSGEWQYFEDGELALTFEGNEKYTPTECDGEELAQKGEAVMGKPGAALGNSILFAVWQGAWTGVPYLP